MASPSSYHEGRLTRLLDENPEMKERITRWRRSLGTPESTLLPPSRFESELRDNSAFSAKCEMARDEGLVGAGDASFTPPQDPIVLTELLQAFRETFISMSTELDDEDLAQPATPAYLLSLACKCGTDVVEVADIIMSIAENCGFSKDLVLETEAEMGSWFADQARHAGASDDLSSESLRASLALSRLYPWPAPHAPSASQPRRSAPVAVGS